MFIKTFIDFFFFAKISWAMFTIRSGNKILKYAWHKITCNLFYILLISAEILLNPFVITTKEKNHFT